MSKPFTRTEVYDLNDYITRKRGTYEDWLRDREHDRRIEAEALVAGPNDSGVQRNGRNK